MINKFLRATIDSIKRSGFWNEFWDNLKFVTGFILLAILFVAFIFEMAFLTAFLFSKFGIAITAIIVTVIFILAFAVIATILK